MVLEGPLVSFWKLENVLTKLIWLLHLQSAGKAGCHRGGIRIYFWSLSLSLSLCVCVWWRTCMHICLSMYTYQKVPVCVHVRAIACVVFAYVRACVCVRVCVYIHLFLYKFVDLWMWVIMNACTRTSTHSRRHVHVRGGNISRPKQTYTHACMQFGFYIFQGYISNICKCVQPKAPPPPTPHLGSPYTRSSHQITPTSPRHATNAHKSAETIGQRAPDWNQSYLNGLTDYWAPSRSSWTNP